MVLRKMLERLVNELSISSPLKKGEDDTYSFSLNEEITIFLHDLKPGVSMSATLLECPQRKREDLFIFLMRANLLGQGTGGARIGIDANEKYLTLSSSFPYEIDYPKFRDKLEDFTNYLIYWREEIAKFEQAQTV